MDVSSDEGQKKKERSWNCSYNEESENLADKENDKTIKKNKIFTISENIIIASEAKEKGLHSTSRKYNIDRKPFEDGLII